MVARATVAVLSHFHFPQTRRGGGACATEVISKSSAEGGGAQDGVLLW